MVIGKGDIASVLLKTDLDSRIFYIASGLSNSSNVTFEALERELDMLDKFKGEHIVYFSSLSIFYNSGSYQRYKRLVEDYIKSNFDKYTIIRLGNIDWGINPNTFINYLAINKKAVRRDELRYIINENELIDCVKSIQFGTQKIVNLIGKTINVKDL